MVYGIALLTMNRFPQKILWNNKYNMQECIHSPSTAGCTFANQWLSSDASGRGCCGQNYRGHWRIESQIAMTQTCRSLNSNVSKPRCWSFAGRQFVNDHSWRESPNQPGFSLTLNTPLHQLCGHYVPIISPLCISPLCLYHHFGCISQCTPSVSLKKNPLSTGFVQKHRCPSNAADPSAPPESLRQKPGWPGWFYEFYWFIQSIS